MEKKKGGKIPPKRGEIGLMRKVTKVIAVVVGALFAICGVTILVMSHSQQYIPANYIGRSNY